MNSRPLQEMTEEELNTRFHPADICAGEFCCIHNPSDHHMVDWPLTFRMDRSPLMERHCEHGCSHPDFDCLEYLKIYDPENKGAWGTHGCDGCCYRYNLEQDCGI